MKNNTTIFDGSDPDEFVFEAEDIEESADKLPDGVIARVTFLSAQQADKKNRNGNIYPYDQLESAVQELNTRAGMTPVFMNASHPKRIRDAAGKVIGIEEAPMAGPQGIAARLTATSIDPKSGQVRLVADIADTTAGRDVRGILKLTGGKIPVSSRSRGRVRAGVHEGRFGKVEGNIIQKGFSMETMDFVTKQSVPEAVSASAQLEAETEIESDQEESVMDLKELKAKHPELVAQLLSGSDTSTETPNILEALNTAEKTIREDVGSEFKERLKTQDEEINNLRGQIEVLSLEESAEGNGEGEEQELEVEPTAADNRLEGEIAALKSQLEQRDAKSWLTAACAQHPQGALILESCEGKASTIAEAEQMFAFTKGIVDKSTEAATKTSAKGLSRQGHLLESSDDNAEPRVRSGRSTLRRLASVE